MSKSADGDGETEGRFFTVSMLADELEVGPFGAKSTVADLQHAVEELTGKIKVHIEALGCDVQLQTDMLLRDLPSKVELAAVAVPPAIVLDVGSLQVRVGFAGEDAPRQTFRSVVGVSKAACSIDDGVVVGDEAIEKQGPLVLNRPVERGCAVNWSHLEAIWRHAFIGLAVPDVTGHSVILTEPPLHPKLSREKMLQVMFEDFGVARMYVACSQTVALYAVGRTTGIVLDIGETRRWCVPVYEGYLLPHCITLSDHGTGEELTHELMLAVARKGLTLTTTHDRELVRSLKEQLCYVSERGAEAEMGNAAPVKVELPGVETDIELSDERFLIPELLFDPYKFYRGDHYRAGLHNQVNDSLMRVDIEIRHQLLGAVVITGGSSLLTGLAERLKAELNKLVRAGSRVEVVAASANDRGRLSWLGASVLASLPAFEDMWVTKDDFEENGPVIVHRKCF